jgi:predicted RNA binding protein YcfA (HicA-like mRNA interferase family)
LPKLPVLSAKKVVKVLGKFGFKVYSQTGSHIHLWNEERNLLVTVPNHSELAKGTLISIMKQARISRDEFISALND